MTEQRNLKRRVRERMAKTGERYAVARRHVIAAGEPDAGAGAGRPVSEESLVRRTGRTWAEWFRVLDRAGAAELSHTEIARLLREEHGVSGWWAQSVTVGYERARGRRAVHERPGGFSVGATRTVAVPVEALWDAFHALDLPLRERTSTRPRSARFDWEDGRTRVVVLFAATGDGRSRIAVEHERLADADEAERLKAFWRSELTALQERLAG